VERRVSDRVRDLEAVSAGELSQGEAARRLGRSRSYVRYRTDPEYRERDRARHREQNMRPEQIARSRARQRVENMTPEQVERRRARARVANLTPEQIDRKRAYDRRYYSKKDGMNRGLPRSARETRASWQLPELQRRPQ
jgi:hypothetical protein